MAWTAFVCADINVVRKFKDKLWCGPLLIAQLDETASFVSLLRLDKVKLS
jgi:hypothetical protein